MTQPPTTSRLKPTPVVPLDGSERFAGLDASVGDFWSWAFSDLHNNIYRGVLRGVGRLSRGR
jgi:hypothetical protein